MDGIRPINGRGKFQIPFIGHDEGRRALFSPGALGHVHGLNGTIRRCVYVKKVIFQYAGLHHQFQFIVAGVQGSPEAVDFRLFELDGSIQFAVAGTDFFQLGPAFPEGSEFCCGAVQRGPGLGSVSFHFHNIRGCQCIQQFSFAHLLCGFDVECHAPCGGKGVCGYRMGRNDHLPVKGFRRSVGCFLHFLKAHVQRMARFFIHMHGNHVSRLAGIFFRRLLAFMVARAGFPFRVLVTFQFMVACADGPVRMPVFFMGVALSTGFPSLVLMVVMAVVRRAGGTVLMFVFRRGRLFSACGMETESRSQSQHDGKIKMFHIH